MAVDAQKWEWAQTCQGKNRNSCGQRICGDDAGNIFVLGICSNIIYFDSFEVLPGTFLLKYNNNGEVLWARNIVLDGISEDIDMFCDHQGNLIVNGILRTIVNLSGGNLTTHGSHDLFIVKYDANGVEQWAKNYGGQGIDRAFVAAGRENALYLCGTFALDTLFFGNSMFIDSLSKGNFVLAKLDALGEPLWIKRGLQVNDTLKFNSGVRLGFTNDNNIIVTGTGQNNAYLYPSKFMTAKFDLNGNLLSYVFTGYTYLQQTNNFSQTIDGDGGIYTTADGGYHAGLGSLGKTDDGGNLLWAFYLGGEYTCYQLGNVSVDAGKNSYLCGNMYCSSNLYCCDSTGHLNVLGQVMSIQNSDILVAGFNSQGQLSWLKTANGAGQHLFDMYVDKNGACYITGNYGSGTVYFDAVTLNGYSDNISSIFTAKLGAKDVSLKENTQIVKAPVKVHPNPTHESILLNDDIKDFRIYNSQGVLVSQSTYSPAGINITQHPPGLYFIEFNDGQRTAREKFLIE
jgi:hypothetical protein